MNILEACADPALFAPWFKDRGTYTAWFAFLAALFGLRMTDEQLGIYRKHTGRTEAPTQPSSEATLIVGRRGGKSFFMALVAVFLACFHDYRRYLAPGERATIMVIAADRKQARIVLRYIRALLDNIPLLRKMVERATAETFDLSNSTTIEVGTASFRGTRGYTLAAVIADEIAYWRTDDDSANPDTEILDAVRPGMATIPTAILLCASSPYARRGALWNAYRECYGRDGAPLVWQATTRDMNPSVPQRVIDKALERDHAKFSAEYLAQFRSDVDAFVTRDVVEACLSLGVHERLPLSDISYTAFVDLSGGSHDSSTLAIAHRENGRCVLDLLRERKPPFSPEALVAEFCDTLRSYRLSRVTGDRYGGDWPREQFRKHGVSYLIADKPRSELYRDLLPALNSGTADLLDDPRLVNQIVGLERRTSRAGRDTIDHAPGAHDDLANAVAGVASILTTIPHFNWTAEDLVSSWG